MKRPELFICILCFGIIGCNGQNNNKFDTLTSAAGITFEEKQKTDLLNNHHESKGMESADHNFRDAAKKATPGVVHIRTTYANKTHYESNGKLSEDFWYRFFSDEPLMKPQADASGVIISSDGYIVTNDHVVQDAEDIDVTLADQRSYKAIVIGIDLETDLALLKIKETNLSFIEFGNSDEVEVGDWVLAVGNPFNLTSTVTAGIVSAKARDINIKRDGIEREISESYIQTDAAVNRGNSGGALVDFKGKLVGINSIIATPTGAYAGYSFATPVNTVKKIINDLLINGKVQRGYLGLVLKNMNADMSRVLKTNVTTGVYVDSVHSGGAAMEADMKLKDIITAIDEHTITTSAQLKRVINTHRPNEKVILTIIRNGKEKRIPLTLKDVDGVYPKIIINKTELLKKLGIKVVEVSEKEKKKLKIKYGLKVSEINKGEIHNNTTIKKGFIITKINGKPIHSPQGFTKALENKKTVIILEGIYPEFPATVYYTFSMQ